MKINIKALELIEKGLTAKTVGKLTESQIQTLHRKLFISEQVVEVPAKKTFKIGPKGGKVGDLNITQDPNTKEVMVTASESEMFEEDDFELDADQAYTGQQGSHDEYQAADDGMDDDTSPENHDSKMMGMSEEKRKPNAYAICHSQVGPKRTRKFERCVKSVEKQIKEGKKPVSLFIESQIMKIVEKHLPPRITKGDLLRHLSETSHNKMKRETIEASEPTIAPSKPITKPGTKPNTKPFNPGKNPFPGEKEAPRAGKISPEDYRKNAVASGPTIAPSKPITKPDTKPNTKPFNPGKNPFPGEKEAPRAGKISPEDAKMKVIDVILNLLQK
jgi:hypothetical protein